MAAIYRGYDQGSLDAQYNNRAMVPDHPRHIERWARDSARAREDHPDARLDLSYGPSPRERLDFFPAAAGAPVHLFIHGGYWRALDKSYFSYPAPAFATSGISFIKLFGLGLTLAVLMDATLIRATLVPAFMKLAGEANWWAPKWMRRIHDRIGFSETEPPAPEPPTTDGDEVDAREPELVGS